MLILGIDTSTKAGDFCIYDDTAGVMAKIRVEVALNHSDTIMKAVSELFRLSGISKDKIEMIALGAGPGSFTGVRVGMGVAKGIAYSMNIPVRCVNTLDALAQNASGFIGKIVSAIDARHGRAFYAVYQSDGRIVNRISEYIDGHIAEIFKDLHGEKVIFLGDGALKNRAVIENAATNRDNLYFGNNSQNNIDSAFICRLALYEQDANLFSMEPYYLVKSQAERMKSSAI